MFKKRSDRALLLSLSLGLPLLGSIEVAAAAPDGKEAAPVQKKTSPASKAPAQAKPQVTVRVPEPTQAPKPPPPARPEHPEVATAKKTATLKLAPSAAEVEEERRAKLAPAEKKEPDPRDATPKQDPRWPTHVDYTRGPGSPLGGGTAADRKATMQEVSGPQQGVIRNRW